MKTYEFDYACAVLVSTINRTLTDNLSKLDITIDYTTVDQDSGSTITLKAKLDPWQIVTGGQNRLINVSIPFDEGFLAIEGGAITGSYDLSGVSVIVQISMGWMGAGDEQQAQGSGNNTKLTFNPTQTSINNNPGYVAPINVLDPDKQLDTISTGLLRSYIPAALVANKDKLEYIFANVNPKPANLGSWLQPAKWQYFYTAAGNVDALCFLCMMSDAPFPQSAFDSSVLRADTECILMVSQQQFFTNVVLPGIKTAYPGGTFTMSTQNELSTITNSGDFSIGSVTASSLTVTASDQGNGLKTVSSGGGPLKFLFGLVDLPGASYSWGITSTNPLQFANQQVSFQKDPNPTITQDHTVKWYDWVLLVVTGITNVVGLVAAIYDAVNGFHSKVDLVGTDTINKNVQASTGGTVVNLRSVVDWTLDQKQLTATDAGLSGAFYVRGNFT